MTKEQGPAFQPLTGIFEPSAIQQLPDGRFLVVEDEKSHPLSLVTIGADGSVDSTALTAGVFQMFSPATPGHARLPPSLYDVQLIGMSPSALSLAGFERLDGVEYAQSWLVQDLTR